MKDVLRVDLNYSFKDPRIFKKMYSALFRALGDIKYLSVKKYMEHNRGAPLAKTLSIRTGFLMQNIRLKKIEFGRDQLIGKVESRALYSAINEYGGRRKTRSGSTASVPARPFLRPALADARDRLFKYFRIELRRK